jgi:hypothetical protein
LKNEIEIWKTKICQVLKSPFEFLNFFGINQIFENDENSNSLVTKRISEFCGIVREFALLWSRCTLFPGDKKEIEHELISLEQGSTFYTKLIEF